MRDRGPQAVTDRPRYEPRPDDDRNGGKTYEEAVAVARFILGKDGPPFSWVVEAGGEEMLDLCREIAESQNIALSRRVVRRLRRRLVEAMRERHVAWFEPRDCESCGERFYPQQPREPLPRFCSGACRQRAYRRRRSSEIAP